jgi:hypothetical protein
LTYKGRLKDIICRAQRTRAYEDMITSHKYARQSHIKEGQELFHATWDTIKRRNGLKLK